VGSPTQFGAATERLDVFVSNAGIGSGEPDGRTRRTTTDGYELRFARELSGRLPAHARASAAAAENGRALIRPIGGPARIINVASLGQAPLDFDDLMLEHDYSGSRAYGQSKLAQIMSGFELAGRVPADELTVNSLQPGDVHADEDGAPGARAQR